MYVGGDLWAKYAGIPFVFLVIAISSFWRRRRRRCRHRITVWRRASTGVHNIIRPPRLPPYAKSATLKAGYDAVASLQKLIIAFDKYFSSSCTTKVPITRNPYERADPCVRGWHCLRIGEQKAAKDHERMHSVVDWITVALPKITVPSWIILSELEVEL